MLVDTALLVLLLVVVMVLLAVVAVVVVMVLLLSLQRRNSTPGTAEQTSSPHTMKHPDADMLHNHQSTPLDLVDGCLACCSCTHGRPTAAL